MNALGEVLVSSVENSGKAKKPEATGEKTAENIAEARNHKEAGDQEQIASGKEAETVLADFDDAVTATATPNKAAENKIPAYKPERPVNSLPSQVSEIQQQVASRFPGMPMYMPA